MNTTHNFCHPLLFLNFRSRKPLSSLSKAFRWSFKLVDVFRCQQTWTVVLLRCCELLSLFALLSSPILSMISSEEPDDQKAWKLIFGKGISILIFQNSDKGILRYTNTSSLHNELKLTTRFQTEILQHLPVISFPRILDGFVQIFQPFVFLFLAARCHSQCSGRIAHS